MVNPNVLGCSKNIFVRHLQIRVLLWTLRPFVILAIVILNHFYSLKCKPEDQSPIDYLHSMPWSYFYFHVWSRSEYTVIRRNNIKLYSFDTVNFENLYWRFLVRIAGPMQCGSDPLLEVTCSFIWPLSHHHWEMIRTPAFQQGGWMWTQPQLI